MEKVIEVLNRMQADGVIEKFAIGGGIAAIRYLEAYLTDDIDVFPSPVIVGEGGLISFGQIYSYLEELGYYPEREYIRIEGWLVQFVFASESHQEYLTVTVAISIESFFFTFYGARKRPTESSRHTENRTEGSTCE